MARELIDFFTRVNDDDEVGAIVVTGEGRAFCAGMDLSREGNVFGLDESLQPTLADLKDLLPELEASKPEGKGGLRLDAYHLIVAYLSGEESTKTFLDKFYTYKKSGE